MLLGVNIDHVATLRQARMGKEPSVLEAALIAEAAGADLITTHLREDRRHIQDRDVDQIKEKIKIPLNFEMSLVEEIVVKALTIKPYKVTIVPEKREEITTEGGLNVALYRDRLIEVIKRFKQAGIIVSLFVDPSFDVIKDSKDVGADAIEIHTGQYSNASLAQFDVELAKVKSAVEYADSIGLEVDAGHGLNYQNVSYIAKIPKLVELNIGHSIISRAIFVGLEAAIKEMKELLVS
ncbi:MAG: pyridoxine 5'-phosphate synthase [Candidatus Margulisbacteria bacterium]|nr:pyridoxine 5'-phosphate synthase [Candidatus Margulisiibacteriota bacterium]